MTAAGAAGLAASAVSRDRSDFGAAYRLALIGAAVESLAGYGLETMPGLSGEPYRTGPGGKMLTAARYLTMGGGVASLAARRSRTAAAVSAALLTGGGLCAKFAGTPGRQGIRCRPEVRGREPATRHARQLSIGREPAGRTRVSPRAPSLLRPRTRRP